MVKHAELVEEIADEPNYDAAIAAVHWANEVVADSFRF
jgi:hypothetical protein